MRGEALRTKEKYQKTSNNNVRHNILTALLFILGLGFVISACNSKDDEPDTGSGYIPTESVAVTAFSLSADRRVMPNLDSVFFSIDLEHGVIFNADSLPRGTKVTALIPKISYPSTVTSAVIEMTGGINREGTVNYYSNASDTIDFTGDVKLTLGTTDNAVTKTYTLKVNVHKEDPDTIHWDRISSMALPSRMQNPKAQKSVYFGSGVLSLIEERDGSYTLATTSDIFAGEWNKQALSLPFPPVIESLNSDPAGNLYILGDGNLMTSADGISWTVAASGWDRIIGLYGTALLGANANTLVSYPEGAVASMQLPAGFPVSGYTVPIEFTNRWTSEPTIVLFGGVDASGKLSSASWAFDGSQWADISDHSLPALDGLSVVNYYSYLNSASNGLLKEFEAYLAFGGRDADGNLNNTVYVTYDHGINWQRAQQYMQLPAEVTAGYGLNALTLGTSMQSNLSNRWKSRRRLPFQIDGDLVKWECPYIFLFGGYDDGNVLNPDIRSGVLQRLTFVPLF